MREDIEAFGVRAHQRVFDAVVHHLYEVARAGWTAMQVAPIGGRRAVAPVGGRRGGSSGRECLEDRVEPFNGFRGAANHQTVPAFRAPHATADTNVQITDAACRERRRARDGIDIVGVAAIDHDVVGLQEGQQIRQRSIDHGRGHHQPDERGVPAAGP
jgi:hypothetical protein